MTATLGLGGYFSNPMDHPVTIIRAAYNNGIRFFDTARAYYSEHHFGFALRNYDRDSYELSTKTKSMDPELIMYELQSSLDELNTNYIDIYFGHDYIDSLENWNQCIPALKEMNNLHQIKNVGVSGSSPEAAILAIQSGLINYIMIPHSIVYRQFDSVIPIAEKYGVKVITMKNFASGIITGGPRQQGFAGDITMQDILDFSATYEGVNFIIPAARSIKQVEELVNAYNLVIKPSQAKISQIVNTIHEYLGYDYCRYCNLCRPCEVHGWKMSQPGILKSHIYDEKFGINMSKEYNNYLLNANDCQSCDNLCSAKCPFGLDIKGQMQEAHEYFKGEIR